MEAVLSIKLIFYFASNCPRRIVLDELSARIVLRRIVLDEFSATHCLSTNCPGTVGGWAEATSFYFRPWAYSGSLQVHAPKMLLLTTLWKTPLCFIAALVNKLVPSCVWLTSSASEHRFSTDVTRTPRGTSAVAKGYAGKNIVTTYFFLNR